MTGLLDEYLTREELASELRISPRTIARWENQPNGLPATELGGRMLYRRESVRKWIQSRERLRNPRRAS